MSRRGGVPDLRQLEGVVSERVLEAMRTSAAQLSRQGPPGWLSRSQASALFCHAASPPGIDKPRILNTTVR